jgi:two-component system CitB family sensor kinase
VLGNLIDNAFDAVRTNPPERERWVDVELRDDGDEVLIRVADSGPGVDAADRDHVFDEGFSTKDASGRTRGLGLALIRQIVQRHGGTIDLSNETGAVFTIILRGRATSGRHTPTAEARPSASPSGTDTNVAGRGGLARTPSSTRRAR